VSQNAVINNTWKRIWIKWNLIEILVSSINFWTYVHYVVVVWNCLLLYSNLDETAKSVFKENVRVTEALANHIDEADQLRDQVRKFEHENRQLRNDQELSEMLVQQKVVQSRRNKQTIKEVAHTYAI